MINVIASVTVKKGKVTEFINGFKANALKVREEPGCVEYYPTMDVNTDLLPSSFDENIVTIIEKWESMEALQDHINTPHMKEQIKKDEEFVVSMSARLLEEV
jgi:quinol monooxygenase YgiN